MKNFLIITRNAPYGTAFGKEALDAVLMASAFVPVSVLFLDDGVFQLLRGQNATEIAIKDYSPTFAVLEQYGVENIYASETSLSERGLNAQDLVITVRPIPDQQIADLMAKTDVVLNF